MGYLGEDIKKLGFGLMRLPRKGEEIDIGQVCEMVDLFMDAGFTYFDTAWAYEGSEEAIRKALVERYPRDSYVLASKSAVWMGAKSKEEAQSQLAISLERTGAGYFDFYLLHNLGRQRTHFFNDYDMWDFMREKKEEGLIRHIGMSAHTTPEELDELLCAHPEMEFVQLQINYADWNDPAVQAKGCYETARKHGKPIIVMEPVKGGTLADPPEPVREIFREAKPDASYASWALRYAASHEGIITVLSGMSSVAQMKDNIATMKNFKPLSKEEEAVVEKAQAAISAFPLIPCTGCNYCGKVCPNNIGIPGAMEMLNLNTLYGEETAKSRVLFAFINPGKSYPSACVECGACEQACPQHLPIREYLKQADEIFFKQKG